MDESNSASSAIPEVVPVTTSMPSSPYALEHLSDGELFDGTRRLIARSNHHLAALLAHLAEVEARGIHRLRTCASLYTYCMYELRLSEDMAYRHARAAKIARRFPILFEQLAAGEIHLTGLLLLGPHLTEENHRALLLRAKHRSKREIEKLVRLLAPLADVPARIEPLGPVRTGLSVNNGTWEDFVTSLNVIRELEPGQRPKDWMDSEAETETESNPDPRLASEPPAGAEARGAEVARELDRARSAPVSVPMRYRVQFTASQEYCDLLERARALLSHAVPSRSIEEIHLRAMRSFVSSLEKRRYASKEDPEAPEIRMAAEPEPEVAAKPEPEVATEPEPEVATEPEPEVATEPEPEVAAEPEPEVAAEPEPEVAADLESEMETEVAAEPSAQTPGDPGAKGAHARAREMSLAPRQRGRNVSAEVRRSVRERDGARCAYVGSNGRRCKETSFLELHHREPFARGGPATGSNVTIYCRSHNALAAEQDFGRAHMERKKGPD